MMTEISIRGLVQGVGLRPFIYLIAKELGVKGTVANLNNRVIIRAGLSGRQCEELIRRIRNDHPPVASILTIEVSYLHENNEKHTDFSIIPSYSESDEVTQVAPDIAVCDDCLEDRKNQQHRIRYPFINCTHCGPRFSIIKDIPYDRMQTTMSGFKMCPDCRNEYTDVHDRRFHAQPVACNHCGPKYYTVYNGNLCEDYSQLLDLTIRTIKEGQVIAVKGTGGYHLVCDAMNESAVRRLREIKIRDTKPFAVMFKDIESVVAHAFLNEEEKKNLTSWRKPIVLLKQHKQPASGINPGMKTLGCMLPYMPLHYDWFDQTGLQALVMTSGNISDRPIIIDPEEAEECLGGKVALLLHHNRTIHNRADDSVLQVCDSQTCLIRRSRGYAPEPFFTDVPTEGILAFGAEKTNTFALGKSDTIIQSQYIGDLKNLETFRFYTESLERFQQLFRFTPRQLVCDLHPDYLSSNKADEVAKEKQLPLLKVQHHFAHAVACMLEYGLHKPVIAVVWDGTGLGDDHNIWGGEFFACDRKNYTRLSHLEYVPMPGGDKASSEPWRMALAYLHHYQITIPQEFTERIGKEKIGMLINMMDKKINTPQTSSAGRLFDALASLLGICDISSHQAEAAVLLEQHAAENCGLRYPVDAKQDPVNTGKLITHILSDLQQGISTAIIAAKIHHSLADLIFQKAKQLLLQTGLNEVVLSGGCFQNKRLTEELQNLFSSSGFLLYIPTRIPCNDSGIAAGQIAVAAARMNNSNS